MTTDPSVSILVLNYNSASLLRECLQSLRLIETQKKLEIIVVDNNSTDNSHELVASSFDEVKWVGLASNMGYGRAYNESFSQAKGEYLIFLNNDVMVEPNLVDTLIDPLIHDEAVGATSPKVVLRSNPSLVQNAGIFVLRSGYARDRGALVSPGTHGYELDSEYFATPAEVDACCGVCLAVRRSDFENLSGFDPQYFMYYEDVDLSLRLRLTGKICLYISTTRIIHSHAATSDTASDFFLNQTETSQLLFCISFFPLSVWLSRGMWYLLSSIKRPQRLGVWWHIVTVLPKVLSKKRRYRAYDLQRLYETIRY